MTTPVRVHAHVIWLGKQSRSLRDSRRKWFMVSWRPRVRSAGREKTPNMLAAVCADAESLLGRGVPESLFCPASRLSAISLKRRGWSVLCFWRWGTGNLEPWELSPFPALDRLSSSGSQRSQAPSPQPASGEVQHSISFDWPTARTSWSAPLFWSRLRSKSRRVPLLDAHAVRVWVCVAVAAISPCDPPSGLLLGNTSK